MTTQGNFDQAIGTLASGNEAVNDFRLGKQLCLA